MSNFNLNLHASPALDTNRPRITNLDRVYGVTSFPREIDLRGGAYFGRFVIQSSYKVLRNFFDTYLGYEVRENNGETWLGIIQEMELLAPDGIVENIGLDGVANAVQVSYINALGNRSYTAFATDSRSIARYGRKEKTVESDLDQTAAEELGRTYLALHAWPRPRIVAMNAPTSQPSLIVRVAGYSYTLSWDLPGIGLEIAASRDDLDELVDYVVGQSAFLSAGRIQENTLECTNELDGFTALDMINAWCDMGDASDNPWTFTIDKNLKVHYEPVDSGYQFRLVNGTLTDGNNKRMNGRERYLRPGVYRRVGMQPTTRPTGWLSDARDFLVERVGVDGTGRSRVAVGQFDEWELANAAKRIKI